MNDDAKRTLERGNEYPYDSPDSERQPVRPALDWAHRAARGVIADLTDRRGIKNGFQEVDEEVRCDIVDALAAVIREAGSPIDQDENFKAGIREGLRLAAQALQNLDAQRAEPNAK